MSTENEKLLDLAERAEDTPEFKYEVLQWTDKHGESHRFRDMLENTRRKPGYKVPGGKARMDIVYADTLRELYGILETDAITLPGVPERDAPGKGQSSRGSSVGLARILAHVLGRDESCRRPPSQYDEVRWVGENVELDWDTIDLEAIPSLFSVSMLAYAKGNRAKFWENLYGKSISNKTSGDGTAYADDGRTTTDLVRQIREYGEATRILELEHAVQG